MYECVVFVVSHASRGVLVRMPWFGFLGSRSEKKIKGFLLELPRCTCIKNFGRREFTGCHGTHGRDGAYLGGSRGSWLATSKDRPVGGIGVVCLNSPALFGGEELMRKGRVFCLDERPPLGIYLSLGSRSQHEYVCRIECMYLWDC